MVLAHRVQRRVLQAAAGLVPGVNNRGQIEVT